MAAITREDIRKRVEGGASWIELMNAYRVGRRQLNRRIDALFGKRESKEIKRKVDENEERRGGRIVMSRQSKKPESELSRTELLSEQEQLEKLISENSARCNENALILNGLIKQRDTLNEQISALQETMSRIEQEQESLCEELEKIRNHLSLTEIVVEATDTGISLYQCFIPQFVLPSVTEEDISNAIALCWNDLPVGATKAEIQAIGQIMAIALKLDGISVKVRSDDNRIEEIWQQMQ